MKAARTLPKLQQPGSLIEFVRQFLTPRVWKQARHRVNQRRSKPRWDLQPLVLVLLAMSWAAGDAETERFVAARGFYVMSYHARKRPGQNLPGSKRHWLACRCQLWAGSGRPRRNSAALKIRPQSALEDRGQEIAPIAGGGLLPSKSKTSRRCFCRLIRVQAKGQTKHDVWLLTSVLAPQKLSAKTAGHFYRWRWRNEGLFRTYKRTLNKVKLASRTVRLIHRELEGSLLALQILLVHADLALRSHARRRTGREPT